MGSAAHEMLVETVRDRLAGPPLAPAGEDLGDLRFKALLGREAWNRLEPAIRRRFSKRLSDGATAVYIGQVLEITTSLPGRILATLARLIGGPLPLVWQAPGPSVVTVTEDRPSGGQVWTRLYARPRGFPQVVHSTKRFAGPTGLEEYVGCGVVMALTVHEVDSALVFRSAGYSLTLGSVRIALPAGLEPGQLTVTHAELGAGRFTFTLALEHPRLGALLHQHAIFREEQTPAPD